MTRLGTSRWMKNQSLAPSGGLRCEAPSRARGKRWCGVVLQGEATSRQEWGPAATRELLLLTTWPNSTGCFRRAPPGSNPERRFQFRTEFATRCGRGRWGTRARWLSCDISSSPSIDQVRTSGPRIFIDRIRVHVHEAMREGIEHVDSERGQRYPSPTVVGTGNDEPEKLAFRVLPSKGRVS